MRHRQRKQVRILLPCISSILILLTLAAKTLGSPPPPSWPHPLKRGGSDRGERGRSWNSRKGWTGRVSSRGSGGGMYRPSSRSGGGGIRNEMCASSVLGYLENEDNIPPSPWGNWGEAAGNRGLLRAVKHTTPESEEDCGEAGSKVCNANSRGSRSGGTANQGIQQQEAGSSVRGWLGHGRQYVGVSQDWRNLASVVSWYERASLVSCLLTCGDRVLVVCCDEGGDDPGDGGEKWGFPRCFMSSSRASLTIDVSKALGAELGVEADVVERLECPSFPTLDVRILAYICKGGPASDEDSILERCMMTRRDWKEVAWVSWQQVASLPFDTYSRVARLAFWKHRAEAQPSLQQQGPPDHGQGEAETSGGAETGPLTANDEQLVQIEPVFSGAFEAMRAISHKFISNQHYAANTTARSNDAQKPVPHQDRQESSGGGAHLGSQLWGRQGSLLDRLAAWLGCQDASHACRALTLAARDSKRLHRNGRNDQVANTARGGLLGAACGGLKGMRAWTCHLRSRRSIVIKGITEQGADRVEFQRRHPGDGSDQGSSTVARHFQDRYGALRFPQLPCAVVELRSAGLRPLPPMVAFYPLEVLDISDAIPFAKRDAAGIVDDDYMLAALDPDALDEGDESSVADPQALIRGHWESTDESPMQGNWITMDKLNITFSSKDGRPEGIHLPLEAMEDSGSPSGASPGADLDERGSNRLDALWKEQDAPIQECRDWLPVDAGGMIGEEGLKIVSEMTVNLLQDKSQGILLSQFCDAWTAMYPRRRLSYRQWGFDRLNDLVVRLHDVVSLERLDSDFGLSLRPLRPPLLKPGRITDDSEVGARGGAGKDGYVDTVEFLPGGKVATGGRLEAEETTEVRGSYQPCLGLGEQSKAAGGAWADMQSKREAVGGQGWEEDSLLAAKIKVMKMQDGPIREMWSDVIKLHEKERASTSRGVANDFDNLSPNEIWNEISKGHAYGNAGGRSELSKTRIINVKNGIPSSLADSDYDKNDDDDDDDVQSPRKGDDVRVGNIFGGDNIVAAEEWSTSGNGTSEPCDRNRAQDGQLSDGLGAGEYSGVGLDISPPWKLIPQRKEKEHVQRHEDSTADSSSQRSLGVECGGSELGRGEEPRAARARARSRTPALERRSRTPALERRSKDRAVRDLGPLTNAAETELFLACTKEIRGVLDKQIEACVAMGKEYRESCNLTPELSLKSMEICLSAQLRSFEAATQAIRGCFDSTVLSNTFSSNSTRARVSCQDGATTQWQGAANLQAGRPQDWPAKAQEWGQVPGGKKGQVGQVPGGVDVGIRGKEYLRLESLMKASPAGPPLKSVHVHVTPPTASAASRGLREAGEAGAEAACEDTGPKRGQGGAGLSERAALDAFEHALSQLQVQKKQQVTRGRPRVDVDSKI